MAENGKWQIGFWIMTGFVVLLATASITGYFKLDSKIVYAEQTMREEKSKDLSSIDIKIEKITEKIDQIKSEQRLSKEELAEKINKIFVALEQIKYLGRQNAESKLDRN